MPAICTVTKLCIGTCNGHDTPEQAVGVWVSGDSACTVDNQPMVRVGDIAVLSCGHTAVAVTGSHDSISQGKAIHRVGDISVSSGGGTFVTVTGSSTATNN